MLKPDTITLFAHIEALEQENEQLQAEAATMRDAIRFWLLCEPLNRTPSHYLEDRQLEGIGRLQLSIRSGAGQAFLEEKQAQARRIAELEGALRFYADEHH